MKTLHPREDDQPWYRQFWPWFLIFLPGSVVVAGISMIFVAANGADDLVVDEYYKRGLAINRRLEREHRAQQLGISAALHIEGDSVLIKTTGPVSTHQLRLAMSHPMEADRDFQALVVESTPGEYRGRLSSATAPRWHWTLEPDIEDDSPHAQWRLSGSLTAAEFSRSSGG